MVAGESDCGPIGKLGERLLVRGIQKKEGTYLFKAVLRSLVCFPFGRRADSARVVRNP